MWRCPNGCEILGVVVCGGPADPDPDGLNLHFLMNLDGTYTNRMEDGTLGVPQECYDHADGGCCAEPICPECYEHCVWVSEKAVTNLFKVLEDIVDSHDMGDGVHCGWCGRILDGHECTADDCLGVRAWEALKEACPQKYRRSHGEDTEPRA